MTARIRTFLVVETLAFALAALIHGGVLISGYEHAEARTAESIIAMILAIGLLASWIRPAWTQRAGVIAQGLAVLGTLIGVFTVIVGIGPRTVPDVIYHVGILVLLLWGLTYAIRAGRSQTPIEARSGDSVDR